MCNHIKANGEKCKKKSKADFCHMHQVSKREIILQNIINLQKQSSLEEANKYIILANKYNDLLTKANNNVKIHKELKDKHDELIDIYKRTEQDLIDAVEVNIKNEKLYNVTKNEVKNMNKTLEKKALIIKYKDEEIKVLMKAKAELEKDANNYRIIIEYEKEKQELINKGIDIYNYEYNNPEFYKLRLRRNQLSHPKVF